MKLGHVRLCGLRREVLAVASLATPSADVPGCCRLNVIRAEIEDSEGVRVAIYEIDDEHHRICFAAAGKERPKDFSSQPGSGNLLQVWKREKN